MTSWLHTLRAAAVLGALMSGASATPYGPGHAGLSYAVEPSPRAGPPHAAGAGPGARASASASPSGPSPSRTGSPSRPDPPSAASSAGPSPAAFSDSSAPVSASAPAPGSRPAAGAGSSPSSERHERSDRAEPSAAVPPSRAGSAPGEGRVRPGRRGEGRDQRREPREQSKARPSGPADSRDGGGVSGRPDVTAAPRGEATQDAVPVPSGTVRGTSVPQAATDSERAVGPPPRILPLGSGLVLIGLGLGLAFFGLRLRRT